MRHTTAETNWKYLTSLAYPLLVTISLDFSTHDDVDHIAALLYSRESTYFDLNMGIPIAVQCQAWDCLI